MAARPNLKDEDRKRPYKPRGPYKSKGIKRGPNPNSWIVGPDTRRHDQYSAWLKHKSQAAYRGEDHELTFEQWETLWNEDFAWENRGRENNSVNLTRLDKEKGWTLDNVILVERITHLQATATLLRGRTYNRGNK
jgi:hypothetical protein